MIKFSIITPTLLRESLVRACESIDRQDYIGWEHIVVVDSAFSTDLDLDVLQRIQHSQRKIIFCEKKHNNYGNTPRWVGFPYATGNYLGYLDDDDYFSPDAFSSIYCELKKLNPKPDAIVFPAKRFGQRFFNVPPGSCMTVTGQYMTKKRVKSKKIRWEKNADNDIDYLHDGRFVEKIKSLTDFLPICTDKELIIIEKSNHGQA